MSGLWAPRCYLAAGVGAVAVIVGLVLAAALSPVWAVLVVPAVWLARSAWRDGSVELVESWPAELAIAGLSLGDEDTRLSLWAGLGLGDPGHGYPVTLDEPRLTDTGLVLDVMPVTGSTVADWRARCDELASALAVPEVLVSSPCPGVITVEARTVDPLAIPVGLPVPCEWVDLERVPVGVTDAGEPWLVGVLYQHLLLCGVTGSGKSGVLWSLLAGMAPAVRDGLVQLHVVDPKGGMELGCGTALFTRFAPNAGDQAVELLRDAVEVMQARAQRLRALGVRKHVPTTDEPLVVVVVDEAAALSSYQPDRKVRTEVESLLSVLLAQGRAVGVSVILAAQDPSKEVLGYRQLVPTRIALRLREPIQVSMVLGPGARDRGARCELISDSMPGVGYCEVDGYADPVRVRAFEVTDDVIDWLAATYAPAAQQVSTVVERGRRAA